MVFWEEEARQFRRKPDLARFGEGSGFNKVFRECGITHGCGHPSYIQMPAAEPSNAYIYKDKDKQANRSA
jgi:hypothetical protein